MDALAPRRFTTHCTGPHTSQVDDSPRPRSSPCPKAGSCTPIPSARGPPQNRLRQKKQKRPLLRSRKFVNGWIKEVVTCVANRAALGWLALRRANCSHRGFLFLPFRCTTNLGRVETHITRHGMMVMMDGWVLWSSRVFDYGHIRCRPNRRLSCFRCFLLLFLLFSHPFDADLRLTFENVCCCSFFQIRTVIVKDRVHVDTAILR